MHSFFSLSIYYVGLQYVLLALVYFIARFADALLLCVPFGVSVHLSSSLHHLPGILFVCPGHFVECISIQNKCAEENMVIYTRGESSGRKSIRTALLNMHSKHHIRSKCEYLRCCWRSLNWSGTVKNVTKMHTAKTTINRFCTINQPKWNSHSKCIFHTETHIRIWMQVNWEIIVNNSPILNEQLINFQMLHYKFPRA